MGSLQLDLRDKQRCICNKADMLLFIAVMDSLSCLSNICDTEQLHALNTELNILISQAAFI